MSTTINIHHMTKCDSLYINIDMHVAHVLEHNCKICQIQIIEICLGSRKTQLDLKKYMSL